MAKKLFYNLSLRPESKWNTVSATSATKNSMLYMQEVGEFFAESNYYTTREGFASYLIKISLDGCGLLQYNGQSYKVPAGKFFWIDCSKWHNYRTDPQSGSWHMLWVHFYGANAQFYHDTFLKQNNGEPIGSLLPDSSATSLLRSLLALDCAGSNQQETDFQAASLLTQLLTVCVMNTIQRGRDGNIPAHVVAIRQYLAEHYREKISLEFLGNTFNMNPCYLQKQFKRYVGQSPTEYLIYLRLVNAKEYLRTTQMSISEIAYAVGIENLGYFTRLFKQQEGTTPQQYRKLLIVAGVADAGGH